MGNCHTLDLRDTNMSDVSMLGNCHTLHLGDLCKLVDVSALGNCNTITMTGDFITDIRMMTGCKRLNCYSLSLVPCEMYDILTDACVEIYH